MAKLPVLKPQWGQYLPSVNELYDYAEKHKIAPQALKGRSIPIATKVGKRKKLNKVRIIDFGYRTVCECCGPQGYLTYSIQGVVHTD